MIIRPLYFWLESPAKLNANISRFSILLWGLLIVLMGHFSKTLNVWKMSHWNESQFVQTAVILKKMPSALKVDFSENTHSACGCWFNNCHSSPQCWIAGGFALNRLKQIFMASQQTTSQLILLSQAHFQCLHFQEKKVWDEEEPTTAGELCFHGLSDHSVLFYSILFYSISTSHTVMWLNIISGQGN